MNPGFLINGVIQSVLGGRRKRSTRALRYLTGTHRGSLWSNPTTLLTAAGLAWGIYESLQGSGVGAQAAPASHPGSQPATAGATVPPPIPGAATAPAAAADHEALRLVRLAISAAHADGQLNDHERAAVLQQAAEAGVRDVVERELQQPTPLPAIVAGVTDPAQRATLYVLAFTIARADEQVSGAERIYLAQLAALLGLDPARVQQLEQNAGDRIEALGDQGQPGG